MNRTAETLVRLADGYMRPLLQELEEATEFEEAVRTAGIFRGYADAMIDATYALPTEEGTYLREKLSPLILRAAELLESIGWKNIYCHGNLYVREFLERWDAFQDVTA